MQTTLDFVIRNAPPDKRIKTHFVQV